MEGRRCFWLANGGWGPTALTAHRTWQLTCAGEPGGVLIRPLARAPGRAGCAVEHRVVGHDAEGAKKAGLLLDLQADRAPDEGSRLNCVALIDSVPLRGAEDDARVGSTVNAGRISEQIPAGWDDFESLAHHSWGHEA